MFNPTLVRGAKKQVYEGVDRTTIKTFKSSENGSTVMVERPLAFVQRAYADVQMGLRAENQPTDIELFVESSYRRTVCTAANHHPHQDLTDLSFDFPILQMSGDCVYKPDRSKNGEFYTSNPKLLYNLINYLASKDDWKRATKSIILDYILHDRLSNESYLPSQNPLGGFPTTYNWRLYDTPGQNIVIETDTSKYYLPTDTVSTDVYRNNKFRSISVSRSGNEFVSERTRIYIPASHFSRQTNPQQKKFRANFAWDGVTLDMFVFDIPSQKSTLTPDGFCHFKQKLEYGTPYKINLQLVGLVFLGAGAVIELDSPTSPQAVAFLAAMHAGDTLAYNTYESCIRPVLHAPQVKFTLSNQDSLHGIGKRLSLSYGARDYSVTNHEHQFREAASDFKTNLKKDTINEYFGLTPVRERSPATFIYDSDVQWAVRAQMAKYNSNEIAESLMSWVNMPAGHRDIKSNAYIVAGETWNPAEDDMPEPDGGTIGRMVDTAIEDSGIDNVFLRSVLTVRYTGGTYIAPVTNVDNNIAGSLDVQVYFDTGGASVDAAALQLLMFPWNNVQMSRVSPGSYIDGTNVYYNEVKNMDGQNNAITGDPHSEYFGIVNSADMAPEMVNWVNLLLPAIVKISPVIADMSIVYSDRSEYLYYPDQEYQKVFTYTIETVQVDAVARVSLRLFEDGVRVHANKQGFSEYGTFQFVRIPEPLRTIHTAPNENTDDYPGYNLIESHLQYDTVGDRVVGVRFRASDPILCGPLSCTPQINIGRPVNNGAIMLPPRLGTYELEYNTLANVELTGSDQNKYTITRLPNSTVDVCCEYMGQTGDESEEHILHVPKLFKFQVQPTLTIQQHTLTEGRPTYIYIVHDGLKRFGLSYRDNQCPVLIQADTFDFFKMFQRSIHETSKQNFRDWQNEGSPFLIRWEELGQWGGVQENQTRFMLDFEPLEVETTCTFINVFYVYENHYLRSTEMSTKFTFA